MRTGQVANLEVGDVTKKMAQNNDLAEAIRKAREVR